MKKLSIITIADAINGTSMPINEFVLFRANSNENIRQALIVCTKENYNNVAIPNSVTVYFVENKVTVMKAAIKKEIARCKEADEDYVFHIHGQKSSAVYILASLFLGIRKRTMFTVHSLCSVRNFKYRYSSYICAFYANYVTCVSNAALEDYPYWLRRIKGKRINAVVNGIDFQKLDEVKKTLPEHYSVCDMNRLICIDRIIPLKNQAFLVKVLRHLPDSKIVFVGSPDKEGYLDDVIKENEVQNQIVYTGLLKREQVYEELNKSGIYLTASTIEGLHNSVLEAMGIGTIPIISDIPAHREIAEKTGGSILLEFDEELWSREIKRIQTMNKAELKAKSEVWGVNVRNEFSLIKMHERFYQLYREMLSKQK